MLLPFLPLEGSIAPSHVFSRGGGGGFQLLFILSAYTIVFLHLCETCQTCVLPPVIMVKQRPWRGRASSRLHRNTHSLHHEPPTSQADTWRNPNNDHLVKHTHLSLLSPAAPVSRLHQRGRDNAAAPSRLICWFNTEKQQIRCCPANNHPSVGRLSLQSKVKGLQEHETYFIQCFGYERPGQMPPLHQKHIYCVLQQLPTSSQPEFIFFNLTDLRGVKAELWKVIRVQPELINVMCSCRKTPRTKLKIKSCCWHSCFDPTQIFIKGPEVKPSPTDGAVGLSPPQTEPAGTSNNTTMDISGLFGLEEVFFLYSPKF